MTAALECWSRRPSIDDDVLEQVLMRGGERSDADAACKLHFFDNNGGGTGNSNSSSSGLGSGGSHGNGNGDGNGNGVKDAVQRKWQRLGRNVADAITTFRNNISRDGFRNDGRKAVWGSVLRNLTQLYPGSQLPERLINSIRRHFDSMPLSYVQAGFDIKEVFFHIRLIEQASEEHPAVLIQEQSSNNKDAAGNASDTCSSSDEEICLFKVSFACLSIISWPAVSCALENLGISCKEIKLFEKKNFTLGVVSIQCSQDKCSRTKIENALKSAVKKPRLLKLTFGLCGCEGRDSLGQGLKSPTAVDQERMNKSAAEANDDSSSNELEFGWDCPEQESVHKLIEMPHIGSSFQIVVDEWQTICSGKEELGKWLINTEDVEFLEQRTSTLFKGTYKNKKVALRKLRGCEKGSSYEIEFRRDILELTTCGHRNILPFYGICVDDTHGMCTLSKFMEGGSLHDLIQRSKRIPMKDVLRIAIDAAEGILFLNDHGIAHRDLNTTNVLLDRQGNAVIADVGLLRPSKILGEVLEYETGGYKWLAPEVIAADPETVCETPMSNAYSFGMMVWEMLTCQTPYAGYSPVQAAVGIAACGLRPDIPPDCPPLLKSLMQRCWSNYPNQRPHFPEILNVLRGLLP